MENRQRIGLFLLITFIYIWCLSLMPEVFVPILYALMAAAFFGGQVVLTMRSFTYVDPQTGSMISMGTCVLVFWSLAPFMLRAHYFGNPGMWVFFANGLIHPLFSMYLAFEATKRMGATISATIWGDSRAN